VVERRCFEKEEEEEEERGVVWCGVGIEEGGKVGDWREGGCT
jgi:hypothetical protein